MRKLSLLICFFFALVGVATAESIEKNSITIIETGEGNSFSPLPLPDGRLLFVTDRADNLDLAIWTPNQQVQMWEQHPADDSGPALLPDGKTVVFMSDRGDTYQTWWQRALSSESAKALAKAPESRLGKYHVIHPFDSNGDGQINSLDAGWIVDTANGKPLTPLSLDADDPVVGLQGVLWFTILQDGIRRIAYIAAPDSDIESNYKLANWLQWHLLQGVRDNESDADQRDLIWDAGIHNPSVRGSSESTAQGRWQQLRARLFHSNTSLSETKAMQGLRDASRMHDPYADRMHYDLAIWLKRVGRGTDALQQLAQIFEPALRERGGLIRANLLVASGHAKLALEELAADEFSDYLFPELQSLSSYVLQQLSVDQHEIEVLRQLYQTKSGESPDYLQSLWQLRLIELYLQGGAYEAGLFLCGKAVHPALKAQRKQLRLQLLSSVAGEKERRGMLNEALDLTREALSIDILDTHTARLHFLIASKLDRTAAEGQWWRQHLGIKHGAEHGYIEALILTYEGQFSKAEKQLVHVVQERPELWAAHQTLGWLLEKGSKINRQRQALKSYETAYALATDQKADQYDIVTLRSNIINLSFNLKLYNRQLQLMQLWRTEEIDIAVPFLMQAARACFKLSRGSDGLVWLDMLPDSLNTADRNLALRLRALLADQSGDHASSIRALSLLIADPDLDKSLRVRLLLSRALAYIRTQQLESAMQDLNEVSRLPAVSDKTGLLRIDGKKLPFDAAWVASSLQAEMQMQNQSWFALAKSLKHKRANKAASERLQGLTYQNLAYAYIRQGAWMQAQKQLASAELLVKKSDTKLFSQLLWMRLRLNAALGQVISESELLFLAEQFKGDLKRSLEIELLKLSRVVEIAVDATVQSSISDTRHIRQSIAAWNSLRQKSEREYPELSVWIDVNYFRWLQLYGNVEAMALVQQRIISNRQANPWLKWWFERTQGNRQQGDQHRIDTLITETDVVLPMHMEMLKEYYQGQALALLRQKKQRDAIHTLFEGERNLTKLRHQAVKSRPLASSASLDRLRRALRADEAMLLIWPSSAGEEESELWWMDYDHLIYKHTKGSAATDWYAAIKEWQGGKKRLFVSFVNPAIEDFEAFRQLVNGQEIVLSPTLLHAATIGRLSSDQPSLSDESWQVQLWQRADASLMDWKWELKAGMSSYRDRGWTAAVDHFERAMVSLSPKRKEKLLQLIAKAALNGGVEERALSIFEHQSKLSDALTLMQLKLKATLLGKQGSPVTSANIWADFYQRSKRWSDRATAANAYASMALRGAVPHAQADKMLAGAISALPLQAETMQLTLLMNRMALMNRFQVEGGWEQFNILAKQAERLLQGKHGSSRLLHLKLMRIEAAWKYGHFEGLLASLDQLHHQIPEHDALRFDLANLTALIQMSMGMRKEASDSFLVARHALTWVEPALVSERLAGWHNNMGRLERSAGDESRALAHFRAAIDIDHRRGDRIGLLYDWKNLARLLVQSDMKHRREGMKLLQKGFEQAQLMEIPQLELEFIFMLLVIDQDAIDKNNKHEKYFDRFTYLIKTLNDKKMNWALHWLKAESYIRQHQPEKAIASLQRSISMVVSDKVPFSRDDLQFHPLRVFERAIALLIERDPQQALKLAEKANRLSLNYRFNSSNLEANLDGAIPDMHGRTRLVYFSGVKRSWCWILNADGIKTLDLKIGYKVLEAQLASLNRATSNRLPVKRAAMRLTKQIWLPLSGWLPESGDIEVVAIGPLERLSFAMLISKGQWLLDKYAFSYPLSLYSGSSKVFATSRMALVSHIGKAAQPLLLASQEVEAVNDFSHLTGDRIFNPTEDSFITQSNRYGWVHLASHIGVADNQPRFSYLGLEQGDGGDGQLHVHELLKQKWKMNTIVLSGCGSSSGENPFAQAFLLAGVNQTVTNIWKGNDLSLSLLMKGFYRQLESTRSVTKVLQLSQQWMRKRHPDPVDWAGVRVSYH
ncbi:CHAT domain-containing protein [Mariprofundus sp. EBB-1]|uniref:CHAT domain-containing protein n=1 Tax=Mariprofundus sp. EBB-1 TaxID=2650971 RepID=UPI000EF1DA73|nr:CHAT domain-containing protein [Mariprofundus sp. EBB-1]RLL50547.1 CHAT domain-containing protein [Mariprofundus sp. EBB-1]